MRDRKLTEQLAARLELRKDSGISHVRSDEELALSVETAMTLAGESKAISVPALLASAR